LPGSLPEVPLLLSGKPAERLKWEGGKVATFGKGSKDVALVVSLRDGGPDRGRPDHLSKKESILSGVRGKKKATKGERRKAQVSPF